MASTRMLMITNAHLKRLSFTFNPKITPTIGKNIASSSEIVAIVSGSFVENKYTG